jgi:general secretion pathway protein B
VSYLLETLKRLEQKRHQEGVSDLLLVQGDVAREGRKKTVWPYILSAALLANAAVALWWIAPWRSNRSTFSTSSPVGSLVARPLPAAPPQTATRDLGEKPSESSKTGMNAKRPSSPTAAAQSAVPGQGKRMNNEMSPAESSVPPRPEQSVRPQQPLARPQAQIEKKPLLKGKIFDVQDLPAAVKSGIPQMKISVHSYEADRGSRLVRINDRTLREGESLTPEIRLEEIIPGGVILSHQGYLFRIVLDSIR